MALQTAIKSACRATRARARVYRGTLKTAVELIYARRRRSCVGAGAAVKRRIDPITRVFVVKNRTRRYGTEKQNKHAHECGARRCHESTRSRRRSISYPPAPFCRSKRFSESLWFTDVIAVTGVAHRGQNSTGEKRHLIS